MMMSALRKMKMSKYKKANILHISNGDDQLGSAKCLYDILSYELTQKDIRPIVLTPFHNKMNEFCENNNIENYAIKYCWFMYPVHDKTAFIKYPIRMAEYYGGLKRAISIIEKKIDLKSVDLIHTNNCGLDIGMLISDKYQIPHVWQLREHGFTQFRFTPFRFNAIQYMIRSPYTTFVAVSETTKAEWVQLGIPHDRILVSYDGVQPPTELQSKTKSDKIRFVMCGAISETKGVDLVVKAFAKLPQVMRKRLSLDLWGDGTSQFKQHIKALIEKNSLKDVVHLKGFTNNIWGTLSNYDVGINCTNFEAFGRCTVEYLMSGMPVLAANTGANTEIITHQKNGYIFNRDSLQSLADGLIHFTKHIEDYRLRSEIISNNAIERFSAQASSERLLSLFREKVVNYCNHER